MTATLLAECPYGTVTDIYRRRSSEIINIFYIQEIFDLKKLLAISLLALYLFNLAGYFLFFEFSAARSDKQTIERLNSNQYDDKDLIEVKLPLNLPYLTGWTDYQRIDGEVEVDGTYYSYVKRKVSYDTLYLMCLPNHAKTKLYQARNEYSKNVNDISSKQKDGKSSAKKFNISTEYSQQITEYSLYNPTEYIIQKTNRFSSSLLQVVLCGRDRPPRLA